MVSSGSEDDLRDAVFVVDANGLPALPGSSIAGVLRHAFPENRARELFGYQDQNGGESSTVEISWGQVHDRNNLPTPFRCDSESNLTGDPVLSCLRAGVKRDHARINPRGVVDGRGKFDELAVPAGARFTFELLVHEEGATILDSLLARLDSGVLRFGGKSRRGLGTFATVDSWKDEFDLSKSEDRSRFRNLPRDLSRPIPDGVLRFRGPSALKPQGEDRWVKATVTLNPEDFWFFGGGEPVLDEHLRGDRAYEALPVTEARIVWKAGTGEVVESQHSIPASGIKGALRHRLAFHGRRLEGTFVEVPESPKAWLEIREALAEWDGVLWWFGNENNSETASFPRTAGRVFISDGWIEQPRSGGLDHVSLDRFTQGPMDGALFDERPLYGGSIALEVVIDTHFGESKPPRHSIAAFEKALDDLCKGKLAIGAGAARGHGFCRGKVAWSDDGSWIKKVANE